MNKIIQVLTIFSLLIFNSCSTEDDSYSLPMAGNECRIVERTFSYNNNKYIHYYDDLDRLILREAYNGDSLIEEWEYVYNGNAINANRYYFLQSRTLDENASHSVFLNSNGSVQRREGRSKNQYLFSANDPTFITSVLNHTYKYDEEGYLVEDIAILNRYETESGEFLHEFKIVRERTIVDGNVQTLIESDYYDQDLYREIRTEYSYTNDSGNTYSGELFLGTPNKNLVEEVKKYNEDGTLDYHHKFSYVLDENSNIKEKATEDLQNNTNPSTTFYNWDCN
ncbi:hypothetical protein [uncultured Aquimarina sp.]|uniref:hypothetical protein n=1 Tax=uncultured Aquimarina sp. TaxID=575652 RepID=UPI00260CA568|nr:hypothetical protein [uncultured Aquimarina sp.]